ncbi:MAG: hypothetical protein AB1813_07445 [Verrucomicrobiota bacterium]
MAPTIAWLAQGRIRIKEPGKPPRTIESKFADSIRERAIRAQQKHAWKSGGDGQKFLSAAMLWGRMPSDPAAIRVAITSLCPGNAPGQLFYSLETDDLCAVLFLENLGEEERRLWNKNDKRLSHLTVAPDGAVACSVQYPFGTANLAVRLDEESGFSEVTEGDSLDSAPRWVPNLRRSLVFQSAGVGRDRNGHFVNFGPFSIQQLDIESGGLNTLQEDSNYDYLTPQIDAEGALYYIARPYTTGREFHPLVVAKDICLFPFRLGYALFHYLQVFSLTYTGKKLSSAGGAQSRPLDFKEMMIWGNRVSASAHNSKDESIGLVPKSWRLYRQRPGQNPEPLANGVVTYDLMADRSIVYSNGTSIFHIDPSGKSERLCGERLIEQVVVLS